ncbi:MAG TPA: T9SS type A sorting domain-containing protein, partial [Adhaeribacter sp.]|nr:T9SS type A sorting domain-containing protein [Adhaeribacter sp.]
YVMAVQVEDYRKIQGVWEKVGAVRRDMGVRIVANSSNNNPNITIPVVNGQGVLPNQVINLRPGTTMNFQVGALDNNAGDVVTLTSDAADVLPGAVFTSTGSMGSITWTPTAAHVRDQLYYFHVTAEDDACAVKGLQTKTFAVRVSNTGGVTGISKDLTNQASFTAYPNPFSAEITFKVKQTQLQQQILIYNVLGQQVDQLQLNGNVNTEQEVIWQNAAKFPAGQYVARFSNGNGQSLKINKLQ